MNKAKNKICLILCFLLILVLGVNPIAFAEEDEGPIIENAIACSQQGNSEGFNAARNYLLNLDQNSNQQNKALINKVFATIQDITDLNYRDNSNIENSLKAISSYKYYNLVNDYYIKTKEKINNDKQHAKSSLNNLKASRDVNAIKETRDSINALPNGDLKNSLSNEFTPLELSINLDYYYGIAKNTRAKEDLSNLLYYVDRITNTSDKQKYLKIIKELERDRVDYAYSKFRDYNQDNKAVTYYELSDCVREIVSPDVLADLNRRLESIRGKLTTDERDSTKKQVDTLIASLNVKDISAKQEIYKLLSNLEIADRTPYIKRIESLEKPLYDELVKKIKEAKTNPDKGLLEECKALYLNIISDYYKNNIYTEYNYIDSQLSGYSFIDSKQYKDIIDKIEQYEEEKNLNDKVEAIRLINVVPYENIRKELSDRVSKAANVNRKKVTLSKNGANIFTNNELQGNVKVKLFLNGYLVDELYTDSTNIGITPKVYGELLMGENKVKITALNDKVIGNIETVLKRSDLIPNLARYNKNTQIKNQTVSASNPTDVSINMANLIKGDRSEFQYAIVASAKEYADSMSVVQLASRLSCPLLLLDNKSSESSDKILKYIDENVSKAGKVFIVGGTEAINKKFEDGLKIKKERISGSDRYETNKAILNKCDIENGTPIIICSGNSYADALSMSPVAGGMDYPILLVNNTLTEGDINYIDRIKPSQIFIAGGNSAVGEDIQNALNNYNVKRISGNDRYKTSESIRNSFKGKLFSNSNAIEVSGDDFVSAILGGIYGANVKCPIVLTENNLKNTLKIR